MNEVISGNKAIRDKLSPEWLRDCVMIDKKHCALVVSPTNLLEHGITNLTVSQNRFCGRTILRFRLDFDIMRIKKGEPITSLLYERVEGGGET